MSTLPVTVLGARLPFIGVGGMSIGGGISYLLNHHGLATDSIIDAQVVLADASVQWARSDEDLMYTVQGAGFGFGAITELVVKAYPKPTQIYSGFLSFPMSQFNDIREHVVNTTATNTDPNVALLLGVILSDGVQTAIVIPIVLGDESFAKQALSWIWELPGVLLDTTAPMSWEELQDFQLALVSHPAMTSNYQQHSVVVKFLTTAVINAAVDWQTELLQDPRWAGLQLLFEPFIPGAFASHYTDGPWPHSSETMHIVQLIIEQVNATDPGDAEENINQLRFGGSLIERAAGIGNVLERYPNYVLQGTPAIEFYGPNLPRLEALKKQFDPGNRFNKDIDFLC